MINPMAEQLSFKLPIKEALGRDAFFISEANKNAVSMLENSAQWPQKKNASFRPQKMWENPSFKNLGHRKCCLTTKPSKRF
jgi:hypothetical protein